MDQAPPNPALLPAGMRDLLPPDAEAEAHAIEAAMAVFASHAYQRVRPPLLEFEEGFVRGSGAAVADQSFRIMDPDTHRMMVVRADITPQIARIAATRLAAAPRPLRLSYAGQCVRVRGAGAGIGRDVLQTGIELLGPDSAGADAEVMLVAHEALSALGLEQVSMDLALPTLVPALLDNAGVHGSRRTALSHALDRKDAAAVGEHGGPLAGMLATLLLAAGPADPALAALRAASLPAPCRALADRLETVISLVRSAAPNLRLTVDPLEFRGFQYHTGLAITVFAPGQPMELGRGGRYFSTDGEPATGITLYPDFALRAAAPRAARAMIYVPAGQPSAALREQGFITLAGLAPVSDAAAEAHRLGCTHILLNGEPSPLESGSGAPGPSGVQGQSPCPPEA
jgi:ATP phosphoribosyltransferase regulatory subunit